MKDEKLEVYINNNIYFCYLDQVCNIVFRDIIDTNYSDNRNVGYFLFISEIIKGEIELVHHSNSSFGKAEMKYIDEYKRALTKFNKYINLL